MFDSASRIGKRAADPLTRRPRHSFSAENALVHIQRVEGWTPADGEVRVLTITDKQFERMRIFWGKRRVLPKKPPAQLELF